MTQPAGRSAGLAALGLAALLALAPAAGAFEPPPLTGRIVDLADVIRPATEASLTAKLASYERATGHQIVVLTTPSLGGLEIEEYAIRVAEAWRIGRKDLDDGAILVVAPRDHRVRIEVGYGLEGVIPDLTAHRILQDRVLPAFRSGDVEGGIVAGVEAIARAASGEVLAPPPRRGPSGRSGARRSSPLSLLWLGLLFLLVGPRMLFFLPFLGGGLLRGGRGGFGGGGGGFGGGFGGGGGGFGGGGASGSW
ncbi:MAG: TPM domain-containing protein [Myxococcota bacterium]